MTSERAYQDAVPNYKLVFDYLFQQGKLAKDLAIKILVNGGKLLESEPNLVKVTGKVTIFGDVHGQFFDLVE